MPEMKVTLRPFTAPNFVSAEVPRWETSVQEAPKWPLTDLDAHALSDLCDEFRREVFKKAGKIDPRERPPAADAVARDVD